MATAVVQSKVFKKNVQERKIDELKFTLKVTRLIIRAAILGKRFFIRDKVHPVTSNDEALKTQRLIYNEYRKKSLCKENNSGLYFNAYTFLPSTTTLISKRSQRVVGTCTIIRDEELGLPSDVLYKKELDELRERGHILAECGALALDNTQFKKKAHSLKSIKKLISMLNLFSTIVNYVYQFTPVTHLVIMVNPKHVPIYKFYGFNQFAEIKFYPEVNKLAVPLIIDIEFFLSSADTNICALFAMHTMEVLKAVPSFKYDAASVAQRVLSNPEFFYRLSEREETIIKNLFPGISKVLDLNKTLGNNLKELCSLKMENKFWEMGTKLREIPLKI